MGLGAWGLGFGVWGLGFRPLEYLLLSLLVLKRTRCLNSFERCVKGQFSPGVGYSKLWLASPYEGDSTLLGVEHGVPLSGKCSVGQLSTSWSLLRFP